MESEHALSPLEILFDASAGQEIPLPATLARLYGSLRFPLKEDRTYVIGNFVSSIDGVVSLGVPGHSSGQDISGANRHDAMLMGLLRAAADAVVQGAGTLREGAGKALTPEDVYPPLAEEYAQLRAALGKSAAPLTVIVTGDGELDPQMPALNGEEPVLVVTTPGGAEHLRHLNLRSHVRVATSKEIDGEHVGTGTVLEAVRDVSSAALVLVEGGPHLIATFYKERHLDEQFLTVSPQIAGRDEHSKRLALVEGATFAPDDPLWGELVSARRAASHLFLRYAFTA